MPIRSGRERGTARRGAGFGLTFAICWSWRTPVGNIEHAVAVGGAIPPELRRVWIAWKTKA